MLNTKFSQIIEKRTGFTLIELLVTISIIAILTALLSVNFIGARQRSQDGVRKADLSQMQTALELYRGDQGFYPETSDPAFASCGQALSSPEPQGAVYMKEVPCDKGVPYTYRASPPLCDNSTTPCTGYDIYACLENEQDQDIVTGVNDNTTNCDTTNETSFPFRASNP